MNFDSSIFPYQTFGKDIIFTYVQGPWSASVSVDQCRSPSLNLSHHIDTSFRLKTFWL
jgi:hypothetical protein